MSTLFTQQLVLAADHAGYPLKEHLKTILAEHYPTIEVVDAGCHSTDSVDYPNIVGDAVSLMNEKSISTALFVCGSGAGVCMGANRYGHLRAILAHDISTALWSRRHNDSNVLCLGGRVIADARAEEILDVWLTTAFDGAHHQTRVDQLQQLGDQSPSPVTCSL